MRYCLNSVLIEVSNGTVRGIATNGCFIGVTLLGETDQSDAQWIMPRDFVGNVVKTRDPYTLTLSNESIVASHGFVSKPIDGKFPNWRRVVIIPQDEQSVGIYDAELLHQIAKASKCLGNKHGYFAMSQYGTSSAPFMIADDFCGVVMPMHGKSVDTDKFAAVIK